ncbi:hypothetical protein P8452_13725 [Trifolium repens]|nr:hypothetical protein P8452_13725 [Trifolium repens]
MELLLSCSSVILGDAQLILKVGFCLLAVFLCTTFHMCTIIYHGFSKEFRGQRRPPIDTRKGKLNLKLQNQHNCIPDEHYVQTLLAEVLSRSSYALVG